MLVGKKPAKLLPAASTVIRHHIATLTVTDQSNMEKEEEEEKNVFPTLLLILFDQAEETADHLLVVCVFSPTSMVQTLALLNDLSLFHCWMATSTRVDGLIKNGFDSILIL